MDENTKMFNDRCEQREQEFNLHMEQAKTKLNEITAHYQREVAQLQSMLNAQMKLHNEYVAHQSAVQGNNAVQSETVKPTQYMSEEAANYKQKMMETKMETETLDSSTTKVADNTRTDQGEPPNKAMKVSQSPTPPGPGDPGGGATLN